MRYCFYFIFVFLAACQTTTKISSIEVHSSRVNTTEIKGNAELDSFIQPYRLKMAKKMNDTIAYAERNGIKYRVQEPKTTTRRAMSYSDNFKYDRKIPWTH